MSNIVFKTLEEAWEYCNTEECDADLLALPPDVDELTDEEGFDDEQLSMPLVKDIPGRVEINIDEEDNENDNYDDEDDLPLAALIGKVNSSHLPAKKRRKEIVTTEWKNVSPEYQWSAIEDEPFQILQLLTSNLKATTPVDIFEEFFDTAVYNMIVEEIVRYAYQKNKHSFEVTTEELKIFIGFLIFSGYHTPPSERDYWSDAEDLGIPLVRNAMSRNTCLEIKSLLHFQDNSKANEYKGDKTFKISPLIRLVNSNFSKWGIFQSNLSIDEMIVRYYGHHPLKQFIRAKPIRFGYKLWAMCGTDGYCFNFSLYCGKDDGNLSNDPLGTRVVTQMLSVVEKPKSYSIFFDNFFSSHKLFCKLREIGFRATGTIREHRTEKCPLSPAKEFEKKGRGTYESQFDLKNKIFVVRWNDNKSVTLATNFDGIEPLATASRWSKAKKERTIVPQPNMINNYNRYMGGVDQHDWRLEKYNIAVRGKKWYWCLFIRIVDMAVVNAFLLFRKIHGPKSISLKDFRRSIAVQYLKLGHGKRILQGRPFSLPSTSRIHVPGGVRFNEKGHFLEKRDKQRRCQYPRCLGKPLTFCSKCNVTLCIKCFPKYHQKSQ